MTNNKIQQALKSGDKIGHLVWYDCENANITPEKLRILFDKNNLDMSYFPDSIKFKNAFQKAVRQSIKDDSSTSDTRRSIAKMIVDGLDKLIYGIVDLDVNETDEVINPSYSDKVWFDKDNNSVSFEHGHPMARRVKDNFATLCGEYTTRDISRMIVRSFERLNSIRLRRSGVVYFVPVQCEESLLALQAVVNGIGENDMRVYEIGAGNASNIANEAKSEIANKIVKMRDDIADLKLSIQEGTIKGATVENSIEVRLRRFRELRDKCTILSDALQVKSDTLMQDLDEVGQLIKDDLMSAA